MIYCRLRLRLLVPTCLYIIAILAFINNNSDPYTAPVQIIREGVFTDPSHAAPPSSQFINVGLIIIDMEHKERLQQNFFSSIKRTLEHIFMFSSGNPLHFVIVTDKQSVRSVAIALADIVTKHLAMQVLISASWRWRRRKALPAIKISFVDIDDVINVNRDFVDALKKQNINNEDVTKDKYSSDLFYIAPLYHLAFLAMDRIIFLDSTDLLFMSDIKDLELEFDNFDTKAVMMIGHDLSPHYRINLEKYLDADPDTNLGLPGRHQGLNTGVVLYHLGKMRDSDTYNMNLTPNKVQEIFSRYKMKMTVGDQDWFTLLSYQKESLISILPCQYNVQTSLQYWSRYKDIFSQYHHCVSPSNVKIAHFNGCGPKPESCGDPPAMVADYREYINVVTQVIPIHNLWLFLSHITPTGDS